MLTHHHTCIAITSSRISPVLHPLSHLLDLSALTSDDISREPYEFWMFGSSHHFCHIDRSLMMWDHPFEERSVKCISSLADHHLAHICHTHRHHTRHIHRMSYLSLIFFTAHHPWHCFAVFCHWVHFLPYLPLHHPTTDIVTISLPIRSNICTSSKSCYDEPDCYSDAESGTPIAPARWACCRLLTVCAPSTFAGITLTLDTSTGVRFGRGHRFSSGRSHNKKDRK